MVTKPYPILATLLGFCLAVSNAAAQSLPERLPDWLQEAMSAESRDLIRHDVALGDGAFRSRLPGRSPANVSGIDDGWYVTTDIGSTAPLECWVFQTDVDPATMANNIANASIAASAEKNGTLQSRSLYFVDMGVIEGIPFLAVEWLYRAGDAPNTVVGFSKVRVGMLGGTTVACGHNTVGYRKTFADAFAELVNAAVVADAGEPPDYEVVFVRRIGDQPVGLVHGTFSLDRDGDTAIRSVDSSLMPIDESNLAATDIWTISFARPDGSLINKVRFAIEDGELTTNLNLKRDQQSVWTVSGVYEGKEISAALGGDVQPIADSGQIRAVAALLADDEQDSATVTAWVPQADPTQFTDIVYSLYGDGSSRGSMQLGSIRLDGQFDANGTMREASLDYGGEDMFIERVWQRGRLP